MFCGRLFSSDPWNRMLPICTRLDAALLLLTVKFQLVCPTLVSSWKTVLHICTLTGIRLMHHQQVSTVCSRTQLKSSLCVKNSSASVLAHFAGAVITLFLAGQFWQWRDGALSRENSWFAAEMELIKVDRIQLRFHQQLGLDVTDWLVHKRQVFTLCAWSSKTGYCFYCCMSVCLSGSSHNNWRTTDNRLM